MRGKRFVVGAWAITVVWAAGGCFKPALERDVDGEDSSEVAETEDSAETSADSAPDTVGDSLDSRDLVDTNDADTAAPLDTPDTLEPDVAPTCSVDGECVGLARLPCVVGRCLDQRCAAVNVSVPCDDGEVCTTADQCQAGVCQGRPFTADESKSWLRVIGGSGVQHVTAVATHPSGHVTIVGAFDEEVTFLGQRQLVSEGGFDGFVVRLSSTGSLVSATRFGQAETDEAPIFMASDGENIGVAWSSMARDASEPQSHFYRVATNTTVGAAGATEIQGEPISADTLPGGDLIMVVRVVGTVEVQLASGGVTVFADSDGDTAYIARLGPDGARWVVPGTGLGLGSREEVRLGHYVAGITQEVVWSLTSVEGGRVGAVSLNRAPTPGMQRHRVWLDADTGALATQELLPASEGGLEYLLFMGSRFQRTSLVETQGVISELDDGIRVDGVKVAEGPCEIRVNDRLTRFVAAEQDGVLGLIATNQLAIDLGDAVTVPAGPHTLAIARYDAQCRPSVALPFVLPPVWDSPARVRELGVVGIAKAVEAGSRGRAFVATPVRGLIEPGGPFGPGEISAQGFSDSVVGSVGPADLYGCVPAPR